jgi:hypothetical protein
MHNPVMDIPDHILEIPGKEIVGIAQTAKVLYLSRQVEQQA